MQTAITKKMFRRYIPVLRNYFDDAALKMATFKPRVEVIGVDIRLPTSTRAHVYVTGEQGGLMYLAGMHSAFDEDGCNKYFPQGRVIVTKEDAERLIHDATHGRYMIASTVDDDGYTEFTVFYLPDGLIDEAAHLITSKHSVFIVAKNIRAIDRDERVVEIGSIQQLKEILAEYSC